MPLRPAANAYQIAHGAGYTRYEHTSHGLAQELVVFVPRQDPVKVMRLRLRNLGRQPRRLAVSGYAEWVLGGNRSQTQHFIVTEREPRTGALLARNPLQHVILASAWPLPFWARPERARPPA